MQIAKFMWTVALLVGLIPISWIAASDGYAVAGNNLTANIELLYLHDPYASNASEGPTYGFNLWEKSGDYHHSPTRSFGPSGHFTQSDPAPRGVGRGSYTLAGGDPVNFVDPSGATDEAAPIRFPVQQSGLPRPDSEGLCDSSCMFENYGKDRSAAQYMSAHPNHNKVVIGGILGTMVGVSLGAPLVAEAGPAVSSGVTLATDGPAGLAVELGADAAATRALSLFGRFKTVQRGVRWLVDRFGPGVAPLPDTPRTPAPRLDQTVGPQGVDLPATPDSGGTPASLDRTALDDTVLDDPVPAAQVPDGGGMTAGLHAGIHPDLLNDPDVGDRARGIFNEILDLQEAGTISNENFPGGVTLWSYQGGRWELLDGMRRPLTAEQLDTIEMLLGVSIVR